MVYYLYMSRYKYKKFYTWNSELAYIVGLIAADGCLINNGRHINVTSKDKEIIDIVQQIMCMNVKVSTKQSPYGNMAYHLQFSNVAFYDFLLLSGLTTAKSKTMGKIVLPSEYYAGFLRGYFDGDGTVYGYWDKRWSNSFMYYTGFINASSKFLQWIQTMNTELVNTSPGKIKPNRGGLTLTYAKTDSQKLFAFMYADINALSLSRKRIKFIDFIRTDPYASKALLARVLELVDRLD